MIDDALFFQLRADALEPLEFFDGTKVDAVRMNLRLAHEPFVQHGAQFFVAGRIGLRDVEDEFVEVERVVVRLRISSCQVATCSAASRTCSS